VTWFPSPLEFVRSSLLINFGMFAD
jgi:hypothetical protein